MAICSLLSIQLCPVSANNRRGKPAILARFLQSFPFADSAPCEGERDGRNQRFHHPELPVFTRLSGETGRGLSRRNQGMSVASTTEKPTEAAAAATTAQNGS